MSTKLRFFAAILLFAGIVQGQPGTALADFLHPGEGRGGKGIAFDGEALYYVSDQTPKLYRISAQGRVLNVASLPDLERGGPLAWDGASIWTMNWSRDSYTLYQIEPSTGATLSRCSLLEANPGHPALTSFPVNIAAEPDGLDWDGQGFWISADAYTGNWIVRVNRQCRILAAWTAPSGQGWSNSSFNGTAGIAFDGVQLWHTTPTDGRTRSLFFQTNGAGAVNGVRFTGTRLTEDLAWDPVTFAPKCALWGIEAALENEHITAHEAPCPKPVEYQPAAKPCDVNGDGGINADDIRLILASAGIVASQQDPRDGDSDGSLTVKDARSCAIRCDKPNCGN